MSILSTAQPTPFAVRASRSAENTSPSRSARLASAGYNPANISGPIQRIQAAGDDPERIQMAAELAYNRSLGRQLGEEILILYRPWDSQGEYNPADASLEWLKNHGSQYGVHLRER